MSVKERFEAKVVKGPTCWEWCGAVNKKGYGQFKVKGRLFGAHRVSWELYVGTIPKGMQVLHRCDNPPCTNVAHLFLGTNQDNMKDKVSKDRQQRMKGENHGKSKLTDNQVREIKCHLREGNVSQREISRLFGVHFQVISAIKLGKRWTHI